MPERRRKILWNCPCALMLGVQLLIPFIQLTGSLTGRELFLFLPEYEHEIRACVMAALVVPAWFSRGKLSKSGRFCANALLPATMICSLMACIPLARPGIRLNHWADALCLIAECLTAAAVYLRCGTEKPGRALLQLIAGALAATAISGLASCGIPILAGVGLTAFMMYLIRAGKPRWTLWLTGGVGAVLGLFVFADAGLTGIFYLAVGALIIPLAGRPSGQGVLRGFYGFMMSVGGLALMMFLLFSAVDISAHYSSEEIASPNGSKTAMLVYVDSGALGDDQYMEVRESGPGVNVLIGRLRRSFRSFVLDDYRPVYDYETASFASLEWLDENTILLNREKIYLDRKEQSAEFIPYVDVILEHEEYGREAQISYWAIGRHILPGKSRQAMETEPFESDSMTVYLPQKDLASVIGAANSGDAHMRWPASVRKLTLEETGEVIEANGTIQKMLDRVAADAEHWIMDLKIYELSGCYFVRTTLNVNLWTPYELYYYDEANDALIEIYTFDDQEIIGLRLHEAFRREAGLAGPVIRIENRADGVYGIGMEYSVDRLLLGAQECLSDPAMKRAMGKGEAADFRFEPQDFPEDCGPDDGTFGMAAWVIGADGEEILLNSFVEWEAAWDGTYSFILTGNAQDGYELAPEKDEGYTVTPVDKLPEDAIR